MNTPQKMGHVERVTLWIVGAGIGYLMASGFSVDLNALGVAAASVALCFVVGLVALVLLSNTSLSSKVLPILFAWQFAGLFFACHLFLNVEKPANAEAVRIEAQRAVLRNSADEQIEEAFKSWTAVSSRDGKALTWSGAESERVWLSYTPQREEHYVFLKPRVWWQERWTLLAKSSNGRYFEVGFTLDGDPVKMVVDFGPVECAPSVAVDILVKAGRSDLIKKFGLPMAPA